MPNLLEALFTGAMTPSQHMRAVAEKGLGFEDAVQALARGALIDDCYYTVGGTAAGQGVVVARDRNRVHDIWRIGDDGSSSGFVRQLQQAPPVGAEWYVLQTNYDRSEPVPSADDRRTPGNQAMRALGQSNVTAARPGGIWSVMTTWPVFNHHTDYTGIFSAKTGEYQGFVWMSK